MLEFDYIYDQLPENISENELKTITNVLDQIKNGTIRAAEKKNNKWVVNTLVKKAILLAFRYFKSDIQELNGYDKFGLLKFDYSYRKVPGAIIRDYVHIEPNAVIMPSCINIGAYIGSKTMIDMQSVIGSCAQIGKNCHISAHACIGGVLEPVVAQPVIIEDNCFVGAHSAVLEGVLVQQGAVIAAGTIISASTKIIERDTGNILRSVIPEDAVVVPGSYSSNNANINCAVIVKYATQNQKLNINELLRDVL